MTPSNNDDHSKMLRLLKKIVASVPAGQEPHPADYQVAHALVPLSLIEQARKLIRSSTNPGGNQ